LEIERIFSYFGPLKEVNYNPYTGKANIIFDLEEYKKQLEKVRFNHEEYYKNR
jgi:hypothetical protein